MREHIIPINTGSNGNIAGGMLKKRNCFEAVVVLILGFLLFKVALFAVPFLIKTVLFIIFVGVPVGVTLFGIGDNSLFEFLMIQIRYIRKRDMLPYKIQTFEEEEEKIGFFERRKLKKKEKKELKKAKKNAKKQKKATKKFDKKVQKRKKKGAKHR